uniref:Uncharacterized protein n=1 Tax=Vespula pensylvanica TaxID=30213 RepID=A0A834JDM7_VESPE|nr:hypothetical protein H0235_018480 [Vespula pensylvanica]
MEQHEEANEIPSVDKLTDFLQKISNFRALAIQYETEEEHEQEYNEESQNELTLHKSFNKSNPTNSLVMSCATKQLEKKITWRNDHFVNTCKMDSCMAFDLIDITFCIATCHDTTIR